MHLDYGTYTDDITEFIDSSKLSLLSQSEYPYDPLSRKYQTIREKGSFSSSFKARRFMDQACTSHLGGSLNILVAIMEELNISLAQYCKVPEFIMKQVLPGLWLLIKTAGHENNIYFTVVFDKTLYRSLWSAGKVFKPHFKYNEKYNFFDVLSVNKQKISHYLTSNLMLPHLVMWMEYFDCEMESTRDCSAQAWAHFAFTLLVFLEDKQETSANLLLTRYSCQRPLALNGYPFNIMVILEKMSEVFRSRLRLWATKRIITSYLMMVETPPRLQAASAADVRDFATHSDWKLMGMQEEDIIVSEHPDQKTAEGASQDLFSSSLDLISSTDAYDGLISFVTLAPVKKSRILLELSYSGSLHNRDENDPNKNYEAMVEKVAKLERSMVHARRNRMGWITKESWTTKCADLRQHEFDAIWVILSARQAVKAFASKHDFGDETPILNKVRAEIARVSYETLAPEFFTLKSSSMFPDIESEVMAHLASEEKLRSRVLNRDPQPCPEVKMPDLSVWTQQPASVIDFTRQKTTEVDFVPKGRRREERRRNVRAKLSITFSRLRTHFPNIHPFIYCNQLCDLVNLMGGPLVQIFKKMQLGGIREIFVLDVQCRLLFTFVERIARIFNLCIPEDSLAKPDRKYERFKEHHQKCSSGVFKSRVSALSSMDAQNWCQQFVTSMFGTLMIQIVPTELRPLIVRIFNLFMEKKIEFPADMIAKWAKDYKRNGKLPFSMSSPNVNEIMKYYFEYEQPVDSLVMGPNSRFMKNVSNMMQGIPHESSSLTHACFQSLIKEILVKIFPKLAAMFLLDPKSLRLEITSQCSSDDSAYWVSVLGYDEWSSVEYMKAKNLCIAISKTIENAYPLFCARSNPYKSVCHMTNPHIEFNSLWNMGNTTWSPIGKFIYALGRLTQVSSMTGRQDASSNLLKGMPEAGSSFFLTACAQEMQARLHYTMLGMNTNKLFPWLAQKLVKLPHPSLGLMLYQPEMCCGMIGWELPYYLLIKDNEESQKIERMVSATTDIEDALDEKGYATFFIKRGSSKKFQKFTDEMKALGYLPKTWRDEMNKNPQVLFAKAKTAERVNFEVNKKLGTPSLSNSFYPSNTASLHVLSSYMMQEACVSVRMGQKHGERETKKLSFVQTVEHVERIKDKFFMGDTELQLNHLFPAREFLDTVMEVVEQVEESNPTLFKLPAPKAKRLVKFKMKRSNLAGDISLFDSAAFVWFDRMKNYSPESLLSAWAKYKELLPFLHSTVEKTLESSKVVDMVSLYDKLSMMTTKDKMIRLVCALGKHNNDSTMVESIITKNMYEGHLLVTKPVGIGFRTSLDAVKVALAFLLLGPSLPYDYQLHLIHRVLSFVPCPLLPKERESRMNWANRCKLMLTQSPKKEQILLLMMLIVQSRDGIDVLFLLDFLRELRKHVQLIYVLAQKKVFEGGKYTYVGSGTVEVHYRGQLLVLFVRDETILSIQMRRSDSWTGTYWLEISQTLRQQRWQAIGKSGISKSLNLRTGLIIKTENARHGWRDLIPVEVVERFTVNVRANPIFSLKMSQSRKSPAIKLCMGPLQRTVLKYRPDTSLLASDLPEFPFPKILEETQGPAMDLLHIWLEGKPLKAKEALIRIYDLQRMIRAFDIMNKEGEESRVFREMKQAGKVRAVDWEDEKSQSRLMNSDTHEGQEALRIDDGYSREVFRIQTGRRSIELCPYPEAGSYFNRERDVGFWLVQCLKEKSFLKETLIWHSSFENRFERVASSTSNTPAPDSRPGETESEPDLEKSRLEFEQERQRAIQAEMEQDAKDKAKPEEKRPIDFPSEVTQMLESMLESSFGEPEEGVEWSDILEEDPPAELKNVKPASMKALVEEKNLMTMIMDKLNTTEVEAETDKAFVAESENFQFRRILHPLWSSFWSELSGEVTKETVFEGSILNPPEGSSVWLLYWLLDITPRKVPARIYSSVSSGWGGNWERH